MIIFFLLLLGTCPASAQMTDLMGSLAVDGMMAAESVKEYNSANLQMKKNQLAQELQMKNIEIQSLMMTNPQNVSRETFSVAGYSASAQNENNGEFSITVKGIEKSLCQTIESNFSGAKTVKVNQNNTCSDKNNIKFYY